MIYPAIRSYPKELILNGEVYAVRFVRAFKDKVTLAECDPADCEIRIKYGQGRKETLKCFIHEVLHAIEFEHEIDIKHKMVYELEEALFKLLELNF